MPSSQRVHFSQKQQATQAVVNVLTLVLIVLMVAVMSGCPSQPPAVDPVKTSSAPSGSLSTTAPLQTTSQLQSPPIETPRTLSETPDADELFEQLVVAHHKPDPEQWNKVFEQLIALQADVIETLRDNLTSTDQTRQELASIVVGGVSEFAAPLEDELFAHLSDSSAYIRGNCAAALSVIKPDDPRTIDALIDLLESSDENLQMTAVMSLRNCSQITGPIREALMKVVESGTDELKSAARETLALLGAD